MANAPILTPSQQRHHTNEMLRNKGIICATFLSSGRCDHEPNCPYLHVSQSEERPIPESICRFFETHVCLREKCVFFHGSRRDLERLKSSGKTTYKLCDVMRIAEPPKILVATPTTQPVGLPPPAMLAPFVPPPVNLSMQRPPTLPTSGERIFVPMQATNPYYQPVTDYRGTPSGGGLVPNFGQGYQFAAPASTIVPEVFLQPSATQQQQVFAPVVPYCNSAPQYFPDVQNQQIGVPVVFYAGSGMVDPSGAPIGTYFAYSPT